MPLLSSQVFQTETGCV